MSHLLEILCFHIPEYQPIFFFPCYEDSLFSLGPRQGLEYLNSGTPNSCCSALQNGIFPSLFLSPLATGIAIVLTITSVFWHQLIWGARSVYFLGNDEVQSATGISLTAGGMGRCEISPTVSALLTICQITASDSRNRSISSDFDLAAAQLCPSPKQRLLP